MGLKAGYGCYRVEGFVEDVGLEFGNFAVAGEGAFGVYAGEGDAEAYGYEVGGFEDNAGVLPGLEPSFTMSVDMPAAGHEHVGSERLAGGEMDEEPFAAGFDVGDGLAGECLLVVGLGELGVCGLEACDGFAG